MSKDEEKALRLLLGAEVKRLREKRGWSMGKLGRAADLPGNTVGAIESGQNAPQINTIWKLARALDVQPHELIPSSTRVSRQAGKLKKQGSGGNSGNKSAYSQSTLDLRIQDFQEAI